MNQNQVFKRLAADLGYESMAAMSRGCEYRDQTLRVYLSQNRHIYGHTVFATLIRIKHPNVEWEFDQTGAIINFKIKGDQNV